MKTFIFFLLIYLFGSSLSSFCQSDTELTEKELKAMDHFANGFVKMEKHQDYKGAIVDLTKAIELYPDFSYIYFSRGIAKNELQDFRGAIADFTKAIDLDYMKNQLTDPYSYEGRAISKIGLKDYKGAIFDLTKAIEIDPNIKNFYYNRGYSKMKLKDFKGAISDFDITLEFDPRDANAYQSRGISKIMLGQKESGCLDLSKAGELGLEMAYEAIRDLCN